MLWSNMPARLWCLLSLVLCSGLPPTDDLAQLCDIFTYTTMISQCNTHHQLRRAMELVAEMRSRAIPLNVHTYSALLNVCLKANELDLSLDVYARMLAEGVTPNLVTYNTLLDIYNKTGRWMDALNVLDLLQHQVISSGNRQAIQPRALAVLCAVVTRTRIGPNRFVLYHSALSPTCSTPQHLCHRGLGLGADNCLAVVVLQNIRPEARTYNAIISTCNGAGHYAEVSSEQTGCVYRVAMGRC